MSHTVSSHDEEADEVDFAAEADMAVFKVCCQYSFHLVWEKVGSKFSD